MEDGVRSRRVHVGGCDAGSTDVVSVLDQPEHVLDRPDFFLLEADNLDLLLCVLKNPQFLFVIEQVKYLQQRASVNNQQCNVAHITGFISWKQLVHGSVKGLTLFTRNRDNHKNVFHSLKMHFVVKLHTSILYEFTSQYSRVKQ